MPGNLGSRTACVAGSRAATTSLPIVGFDYESDPVAAGYGRPVPAHPGGNVTGSVLFFVDQPEVSATQLQLLARISARPHGRIAVAFRTPRSHPHNANQSKKPRARLGVMSRPFYGAAPMRCPRRSSPQRVAARAALLSAVAANSGLSAGGLDAALKERMRSIGGDLLYPRDACASTRRRCTRGTVRQGARPAHAALGLRAAAARSTPASSGDDARRAVARGETAPADPAGGIRSHPVAAPDHAGKRAALDRARARGFSRSG